SLGITVSSHAVPVPAAVLRAADAALAACPRLTTPSGVTVALRAGEPPPLGEESRRIDLDMTVAVRGARITGRSAAVLVRVGHNLVEVTMTAIMEPLDESLLREAVLRTVRALGTPAPTRSPG
ncbi:MAG TPA: hypothetical protein VNV66_09105, partial [Pilimelia sp.]|nr:hypothetical protein [Pilimelia sp.]